MEAHQAPPSLGFSRQELEWVAISFSNAWKWKVKVKSLSHVRLLVTPWTAAHQAPPSMGFSRQEFWSGVPLPSPNHYSTAMKTWWYFIWLGWEFCSFTTELSLVTWIHKGLEEVIDGKTISTVPQTKPPMLAALWTGNPRGRESRILFLTKHRHQPPMETDQDLTKIVHDLKPDFKANEFQKGSWGQKASLGVLCISR